jgi:hypothetical protein
VAVLLALGAVLGQLLVVLLHLTQIQDSIPLSARIILGLAALLTIVFACCYAWVRVRSDLNHRVKEKRTRQRKRMRLKHTTKRGLDCSRL